MVLNDTQPFFALYWSHLLPTHDVQGFSATLCDLLEEHEAR